MSMIAALVPSSTLAFFSLPGGAEWIIILVIGLLLFGRRLPEVGRSIGQGIKEFKKGLKETEDDVRRNDEPARRASLPHEQTMPSPEKTGEHSQTR
jgi:sec-independent protein translocase protein TatA